MATEHQLTQLEMEGDRALFEGKIQGIVAACYQNERPLQGLAGLLDWRFHGCLSYYVKRGAITGEPGECVYVPVTKGGRLFHIILIGAGRSPEFGRRLVPSDELLELLRGNLEKLRLERIGISRRDFGDAENGLLAEALKGVPLCILQ